MMFIQADPFEREFSQSQQSGGGGGRGGGGGGNQPAQISQREKEIISTTFKQQSDKNATQQQATDIAKLLSQSQSTLHDQAVTLSGRLQARELTDESAGDQRLSKETDAIAASGSHGRQLSKQLQQAVVERTPSPTSRRRLVPTARRSHLPEKCSGCLRSARWRWRRRWRRRGARFGCPVRPRARHREKSI